MIRKVQFHLQDGSEGASQHWAWHRPPIQAGQPSPAQPYPLEQCPALCSLHSPGTRVPSRKHAGPGCWVHLQFPTQALPPQPASSPASLFHILLALELCQGQAPKPPAVGTPSKLSLAAAAQPCRCLELPERLNRSLSPAQRSHCSLGGSGQLPARRVGSSQEAVASAAGEGGL